MTPAIHWRRHALAGLLALGTLVALAVIWLRMGAPYSLDEALFLYRLSVARVDDAAQIDLGKMMPGDWEMVCESHGYDGPLYLERYGRTYQPVGPAQDSAGA